jgi:hypothetical protein
MCVTIGTDLSELARSRPRLTQFQIRVRERVDMIRSCEPEFKERVVIRVRRRAEIQKREAEVVDSPTSVVSAGPRTLHQCI